MAQSLRLIPRPRLALGFLLAVLLIVLLLQGSSLPALSYLGLGVLLFPFLSLLLAAVGGILPFAAGLILMVLPALRLFGAQGLWMALYVAPAGIVLLACLEYRTPFFRAVAMVLAALVLSILTVFIVFQRRYGGDLYGQIAQAALKGLDAMRGRDDFLFILWQGGFLSHGQDAAESVFISGVNTAWAFKPEVREEFYKQISARVTLLASGFLPGLLTTYAISVSLLGTGLSLKLARRWQTADSLGMPPFSAWYLPKSSGTRMLVLALGYLAALLIRNPVVQTAGQLMYNVFFALYAIQGLAYVNFLLKRRGVRRFLRLLLLTLLFLFLPPVAMLLGLYDQMTDPRRLRAAPASNWPDRE